jgi:hypothetical protein
MFKKLICLIKGHKHPLQETEPDVPIFEMTSIQVKGLRYSVKFMPCERCIAYPEFVKYTEAEWQKLIKEDTDKYMERLESYLKKLGINIDKTAIMPDSDIVKPSNKFWN